MHGTNRLMKENSNGFRIKYPGCFLTQANFSTEKVTVEKENMFQIWRTWFLYIISYPLVSIFVFLIILTPLKLTLLRYKQ